MTAPALAPVVAHPRMTGTLADRAAVAEALLVAHARQLADVLGLDDVPGLLGGASGLAASGLWDEERRR